MDPRYFFLHLVENITYEAKNTKMTHNKTEEELLDLQDDEKSSDVDEKTSDTFDVDDSNRLQDGARITCGPNKDSTPASSQEISLLISAI